MSFDVMIIDWIFIILSTVLSFFAVKRIMSYKSVSIADYVIALIYIFNCIPVLLDLVVGIPEYVYWYKPFEKVIGSSDICLIYNTYVIIVIFFLELYVQKSKKKNINRMSNTDIQLPKWRTKAVDFILIVLPILYVLIKYGLSIFLGYTQLSQRGIISGDSTIINQLILLGLYIFITRFFSAPRHKAHYIIMLGYFFILIWLNGKRYMIVTIGEAIFFIYQMKKKNERRRIKLVPVIIMCTVFIVAFSIFYLTNIKVTSAVDYMYGTLRVDFGRDDVTKYVIDKVLINNEKIIEYPGATFLSTLFFFIPRSLWASKPYPHYMYLTSSILGVSISNIPAGTTPSIFEMSLCNFGWLGIAVTVLILILLCKWSDKSKDLSVKFIMLLVLTNILSQAIDAVMILFLVLAVQIFTKRIRFVKQPHSSITKQNYTRYKC